MPEIKFPGGGDGRGYCDIINIGHEIKGRCQHMGDKSPKKREKKKKKMTDKKVDKTNIQPITLAKSE